MLSTLSQTFVIVLSATILAGCSSATPVDAPADEYAASHNCKDTDSASVWVWVARGPVAKKELFVPKVCNGEHVYFMERPRSDSF